MHKSNLPSLAAVLLALPTALFAADIKLASVFADHAVLQRDVAVPVWGWADPGEELRLEFAGQKKAAKADATGKWLAKLDPMPASTQPHTLVVQSKRKNRAAQVSDILVGDVWLCAGQSNMEMGIGVCNVPGEIAKAGLPDIRLMTVPRAIATAPRQECATPVFWKVCSPATVTEGGWGGFSAAAFFFGRKLQQELAVPIGLVNMSWGGTAAESWTRAEALRTLPALKPALDNCEAQLAEQQKNAAKNAEAREAWWQQRDPGSAPGLGWAAPSFDSTDWKTMALPNEFAQVGLESFDGIVWFRRSFNLPSSWMGRDLVLSLGPIDDCDTTWVNGAKVGETFQRFLDRYYRIPARCLKAGQNTIAIRVLDVGSFGGIYGQPEQMWLKPADGNAKKAISLAGEWRWKASAGIDQLKPLPQGLSQGPHLMSSLYNGMTAPLVPFAIKGAIWYQGESNTRRPGEYRELLSTMIRDWRVQWGQGDFPFLIQQLVNFTHPPKDANAAGSWPYLREAQAQVADTVANCGIAVGIEIGHESDIHPKNKLDIGNRLALVALEKAYGKKIESSGPRYESLQSEGAAIRVKFSHAGGLMAKEGALKMFAIAGADQKFVWADAKIEGDTVVVSSPQVPQPVAVRYAWADNPAGCNLFNQSGLPAAPFRTDDWK